MNKYNLASLQIGQSKLFSLDLYDKVRMSAHFTGKRYGWKFRTKKLKKKVRVSRVS